MVKQVSIKKSLEEIRKLSGADSKELTAYFNKILRFLDKHTSCDRPQAIQVALNETFMHFGGEPL